MLPLERRLLETDCPYMAPEPHRGERNNSSYLSFVAEKIAELKGITRQEVEQVTWDNAMRLFDRCKVPPEQPAQKKTTDSDS